MKKQLWFSILIILFVSFCITSNIYAQEQPDNKNKKKKEPKEIKEPYLFAGGSLWLGFGSYTFVDVNLLFGTQLTERVNVGVSGKYQYYNYKRASVGDFQTSVYGGSVFTQFAIIKDFRNFLPVKTQSGIIAHAEYEMLNTKYNYVYFNDEDANRSRYWLQNFLLGGGYNQRLGKKANSYIIILWNLTPANDNPYTYPQIKIGFTFTL